MRVTDNQLDGYLKNVDSGEPVVTWWERVGLDLRDARAALRRIAPPDDILGGIHILEGFGGEACNLECYHCETHGCMEEPPQEECGEDCYYGYVVHCADGCPDAIARAALWP